MPVAAKIALHTAGAIGAVPGSPMPPGPSALCTICTSLCGLVDAQQIVIVEVRLLDAAVGNGDFTLKRN